MKHPSVVDRLLADRIGLDPSTVGEGLIVRGVLARMSALGLRDRGEYERVLVGSPEELQALVEEVVVPESWFFRDARPFEIFREFARAGWLIDPARPSLSVLSVPCAGGEEPYSIAMTLLEVGLTPGRFRVDAVDVSARSLARAIAGVYGPNSFRGVDGSTRSRYFHEQRGAYTVDPAVRSSVRFHLGNLLDPGLLADRPAFDVVFCRNLLIYLDAPARAAAFASIGRLLAEGGLLLLGHADRPDDSPVSPFTPMVDKGSFAYRKGPAAIPSKGKIPARPSPSPLASGGATRRKPAPIVHSKVTGAANPFTPALSRREREAEKTAAGKVKVEPSASALEAALKLADAGRYDEASRQVERVIAESGASARAYFLLGMIRQAAGDRDRAEASFLKAVYLDGQDDEALLALALLARRRGDVATESVYRRRAERVRSRKGAS
jgi:chemotaxis protein methyltransferase WspC